MFGILFLLLPVAGAYAVYVDATDRKTEGPIWWALLTLVVGYGIGPIAMGVFLVCYLLVHLLEEWWAGDRGDARVQA